MKRINAIYARQSVDRADSISIESQIEFCKYELKGGAFREYKDKGYSGKNTVRPQLQQLLEDIRRGEVEKVYLVWVTGYEPGKEALLGRPITLDGYRIRPPKVTLQRAQGTKARLEITIHEGRNRQIRRMCQQAGLEVTRLKRIREGALSLGTLPPGAWRYLTEEEIRALQSE